MRPLDRNAHDLLLAIAVLPADSCGPRLRGLAREVTCWEETIDAARQHGILPMLYSGLIANRTVVPRDALQLAGKEFERNAFHCMANAAELLSVMSEFEKVGIRAIPFKGVVLGASAYGDITMRSAGDLDVLIYRRDLIRAVQILQKRGYELKTNVPEGSSPEAENHYEYHLERAEDGMVLELRWRLELSQRCFRRDLGLDWLWPRHRTAKLAGTELPHLDPESALLVLCMHGSKHVWSRLIWICDVARLLASEPRLDWDSAKREARRVGLWRPLALGVLLARSVGGAQVPADVLRSFEGDRTARRIAEFLAEHILVELPEMPDGRVPYDLQLLGFRDRTRALLSTAILRPNERDRAVVPLPKALEPLYYVIRPVRLLLDRSGR